MTEREWDAWTTRLSVLVALVWAFTLGYKVAHPAPAPSTSSTPSYRAMDAPAAPSRLVVPALKIDAPVRPIEVSSRRVLDPPRNPRDVGWWQRSARAGARTGQTVLTGHTVYTGGGVMDDLGSLRSGRLVKIVTPGATMVYRTTRVVTWTKDELAQHAADIFGQDRRSNRLVLITCDEWTGSTYLKNIVVFATPLGVREEQA